MHYWILLGLILVLPITLRTLLGLGHSIYCGPLPAELTRKSCYAKLFLTYWVAATSAFGTGFFAFAYSSSSYRKPSIALVAAFTGIAVALVWARFRLRQAEFLPAGPPKDTEDERLFPSDKLAMALTEGHVMPLPVLWDVFVLAICITLGVVTGNHAVNSN